MIPRFPMTPETAKAIIAEYEERRKRREQRKLAKALARELEAAVRDEQGPAQPALTGGIPTVLARMRSRCVRWLLPLRWGIGSRTKRINLHRLARGCYTRASFREGLTMEDDLDTARGLVCGVLLSIPFYALLALFYWR